MKSKQPTQLKSRFAVTFIMAVSSLLLLPQKALAGVTLYDKPEKTFQFTTSLSQPQAVQCKILLGRKLGHTTFSTAIEYNFIRTTQIGLIDESGNKIPCFKIYQDKKDGNTIEYVAQNLLPDESSLLIEGDTKMFVPGTEKRFTTGITEDNDYWITLEWYYPPRFSGKKYKYYILGATVDYLDDTQQQYEYSAEFGQVTFDELSLDIYDPIPSTEEPGFIIPFVSTKKINEAELYSNGTKVDLDESAISISDYNGFILYNPTIAYQNISINANITTATWDNVEDGAPTSNSGWFMSEPMEGKLSMVHAPVDFKASLRNGAVELTWKTENNEWPDMFEGDFFYIQRSLSGSPDDFEDLQCTVMYNQDSTEYSFIDETLASNLIEDYLDKYTDVINVKYRICRATSKAIWGWEKDPTVRECSTGEFKLSLLKPVSFKTLPQTKEQKQSHEVTLKWLYDSIGIWDDRAQMKIVTVLSDKDGNEVDRVDQILAKEQVMAGTATVSVRHSCLNHAFQLVVDSKESPIPVINTKLKSGSGQKFYLTAMNSSDGIEDISEVSKLTDMNLSTKWNPSRDLMFAGEWFAEFRLGITSGDKSDLYKYSIITADDCENNKGQNPKSWKLYGLTAIGGDVHSGELIAEVEDSKMDDINSRRYDFYPDKKSDYKIYRLVVTDNYGGDHLSIAELEMYPIPTILNDRVTRYTVDCDQTETYYMAPGSIEQSSLATETRITSVYLSWALHKEDDEDFPKPVDYFEVLRKIEGQPDSMYIKVATIDNRTEWIDHTVSPVYKYIYKVRSVVDCVGIQSAETTPIEGFCVQTGSVEGYVRFADGTGIPGLSISISPNGDETGKNGTRTTVTTDESGHFKAEGLAYYGSSGQNGSYLATVNGISMDNLQADCQGGLVFSFGTANSSNVQTDVVFTVVKGCKLTGTVMYSGTSIPVKDVHFIVLTSDTTSYELRSAGKPVVTDSNGDFSFFILKDQGKVTVQAVKEGHTFDKQYGHFTADTGTDGIAGIYLYDNTRVKLIGRIAGGHEQGDLPLGASLSRNNLGQDIKMVLALEGDNKSWLVYDVQNRSLTERDESFNTDSKGKYKTRMYTSRHRVEIYPDETTGEYCVMLPPVKWKVQQITAEGYPTLFQPGKTGDVLDLTESLTLIKDNNVGKWITVDGDTAKDFTTEYHARYDRIYHSPVELYYSQENTDKSSYFGDRYFTAQNLGGDKAKLTLAYTKPTDTYIKYKDSWPAERSDSLETVYTFGYPVFSTDRSYSIKLSAREIYYWNNDQVRGKMDIVKLNGGTVTVQNQLISGTHSEKVQLDDKGEAFYSLYATQTPYSVTGENALRNVTWTLEMDGVKYEASPLRAYVMSVTSKKGAKDILSIRRPMLVDILRDPPGGSSSASIKKGSTLKSAYKMDLSWAAGIDLGFTVGTSYNMYSGAWAGVGAGAVSVLSNGADDTFSFSLGIVFSGSGERAFSYTMTANEDISTSSTSNMVGADADIYIGMEHNIYVTPAVAVRAVPDSMFQQLASQIKAGGVVEIARGVYEGQTVHLIRDEVLSLGDTVVSVFHHSQKYILKQLIPELTKQCRNMMFTGTKQEAQQKADLDNKPVYLIKSDISETALKNVTEIDVTELYERIFPSSYSDTQKNGSVDKVNELIQSIQAWYGFIRQNEQEKLEATDLVRNFDVDGGTRFSYSETFSGDYSTSWNTIWPLGITSLTDQYFDPTDAGMTGNFFGALTSIFGPVINRLSKTLSEGTEKTSHSVSDSDKSHTTSIDLPGFRFKINIAPVVAYDVKPRNTESKQYNRTESFSIGMDSKSHLNFDVYRVLTKADSIDAQDEMDVFVDQNYLDMVTLDSLYISRHSEPEKWQYARSFVYRTRGGATCRPYEDERKTIVYNPGTVLDERTKKIENPVITIDKQSVSGVPYGEPARFRLFMTNESEQPELTNDYYGLYLNEISNPKGAKLLIDGMPLTGDPRTVLAKCGSVNEKTLEVYAGEDFDYENLTICLESLGDGKISSEVAFSVHFLRSAGPVDISMPGDKWIMNTDASQDSKGYYMPVVISGYDKNQKNFDHIEFQYKESTRGDDYWTNLCSFYASDSLYQLASGTKEMIPDNGFINTRFYGEGVEMEKAYDLRAVLFARNGSEYLTNSSKVLSGIKDTRRPQLFGEPEPKNGILTTGKDIVFNFSEDIEYNYLSEITNFEVVGETNESGLTTEPSLLFSGTGYAWSDARRNFTDKDVTIELMVKPDDTGRDMPIFSHNAHNNTLQLWITSDRKLKAMVGEVEYTSTQPIGKDGFQPVAMVLDCTRKQLRLYNNTLIGSMDGISYSGFGELVFGATDESDTSVRQYYSGRMLEARVWNRAMDQTQLNIYANRSLTGYEMGLIDYYPFNEGEGTVALDKAQGAHLSLSGVTWALPRGMSLHLDAASTQLVDGNQVNGLKLKAGRFSRSSESDYTLMFWFKTDAQGRGALISNGSGRSTDVDASGKFFIGFEDESLIYRTNGMELVIPGNYSDDAWHHYAMTVNRAHNTANIYIDRTLRQTFRTDSLGGMTGDDFYLGNMVYYTDGAQGADVMHQEHALTGNIDELCLFGQALPLSIIKRYTTKSPVGTEKGLITYLSFSRQIRDAQNQLVLEPYALSNVISFDMEGNQTENRDTVFVLDENGILAQIDAQMGAPVQMYKDFKNLNFKFVGRDNQLILNINEPESRIDKRNVVVTLIDIPDVNGNYLASPVTEDFYVDLTPLRWNMKTVTQEWFSGERAQISLLITNESGTPQTYTIENMPRWMTANKVSDIIDPQEEQQITFYISPDLNVGSYDEIIYLTSDDGFSEPVSMNLTVKGQEPQWTVDPALKRYSMNIIGQIQLGNDIVTDERDIVAAFDNNGVCHGRANIDYNEQLGQAMVYLTAYDSIASPDKRPILTFRLWHYATGKVMILQTAQEIRFGDQSIVGSVKEPVLMKAYNEYVQILQLEEGWNWISFNVHSDEIRQLIQPGGQSSVIWKKGDIITNDNNDMTLTYASNGKWESNIVQPENGFELSPTECYRIKVDRPLEVEFIGSALKDENERTIKLKSGWNGIGYTPMVNLPVATALADYWSNAIEGDLIKSQHEFAMFTEGADGSGEWTGSLKYLKPGEGYMLKRTADSDVDFHYPYYEPGETFIDASLNAPVREASAHSATMSMVASVNGVTLQDDDRLVAYCNGEICGEAKALKPVADGMRQQDSPLFYISISGDREAPVSFMIERDGNIVATAWNIIIYKTDAVSGSPSDPTRIDFRNAELVPTDGWYSVHGIKLPGKPEERGIYIHNGKKEVIR